MKRWQCRPDVPALGPTPMPVSGCVIASNSPPDPQGGEPSSFNLKAQARLLVNTTYLQEGVHLLLDPVHKSPLDD